jgi:hypothetical protein
MNIFLLNSYSPIMDYFQEESFNVPFLGSTLFDYHITIYQRLSSEIKSNLKIFVPPEWENIFPNTNTYTNIPKNFSDKHELVFITDLFNLPIFEFTKEDYHSLVQSPGKLYSHKTGFKVGYLNKNSEFSSTPVPLENDTGGFLNIIKLNENNFLKINQTLVNNFSGNPKPNTYGSPVIACDASSVVNSKISGPCFIGEDVKVYNSIIYPGTILTGRTVVQNSEVFESFVCESTIKNSTVKNTLSVLSNLEDVDLKDSLIPRGSVILNERKR